MIKHLAYSLKEWFKQLFCYPRQIIDYTNDSNYDVYWSEKRGKHIGDLSNWQRARADLIVRVISKNTTPLVLVDVGCGDGSVLNYVSERVSNIQKIVGYDSSEFALDHAKKFGIETHLCDISKPEEYIKFQKADYYVLLEVLEHIPQSEQLLIAVIHMSEKGVLFSFPNTGYFTHRVRMLFGKFPVQWRVLPNEHVRFWTYADLKWWLNALGLHTYEISTYQGIPFLNALFPSLFAAGFFVHIKK